MGIRLHRNAEEIDAFPVILWAQFWAQSLEPVKSAPIEVWFAARARVESGRVADVRLAFGFVAPTVGRATKTEWLLRGSSPDPGTFESAVQALDSELTPIGDIRSTARHRRRVAANVSIEFAVRLR